MHCLSHDPLTVHQVGNIFVALTVWSLPLNAVQGRAGPHDSNTGAPRMYFEDCELSMTFAYTHDSQVHGRSPALLTRMCRAPYFSIVALMILGAKSSAVTSPGTLSASPPASRMLDATCTSARLCEPHQKMFRCAFETLPAQICLHRCLSQLPWLPAQRTIELRQPPHLGQTR